MLIRTSTGWLEVLDKGTEVVGGVTERDILQAVELSRAMYEAKESVVLATDYSVLNVSVKVVKIIQSYVKIENKVAVGKRYKRCPLKA